jgi:hypothetical protein
LNTTLLKADGQSPYNTSPQFIHDVKDIVDDVYTWHKIEDLKCGERGFGDIRKDLDARPEIRDDLRRFYQEAAESVGGGV